MPSLNLKQRSNGINGIFPLELNHWHKIHHRSLTQPTTCLTSKRLFKKTLKTDTGKTFVRSHINENDAQRYKRIYQPMPLLPPRHPMTRPQYYPILLQQDLGMAVGRMEHMPSYIGRTKPGSMRRLYQLLIISLKVQRRPCCKMQSPILLIYVQ